MAKTVSVYNPQWSRDMPIAAALLDKMRRNNFTPSHTGGGCFTWERMTDDGGYIWITDDSGISLGEWADRNKPRWLIGRYSADGDDWITVGGCSLNEALRLAYGRLRAPTEGENSSLNMLDYRED